MKIKLDYVTNSSSTGFIVGISRTEVESFAEYIAELNDHEDAANEGVSAEMFAYDKKELDEYTNDGPIDWAQKPTGPRFERLGPEQYKSCLEIIENGGVAIECWIDNNVCEKFDDDYGDKIVESFC